MNETEENKSPEQSEADQPETEKPEAEQPETEKPEQAPEAGQVNEPSPDDTADTADAAVETAEADAPKEDSKAEEKEESPEKAKPARTKQPSMMDEPLNISEDKQWYVVQAFSGYEASVKRSLLERIERAGLGKEFGEILVPTEEVVEIRGGQKRRSERKFFPGYVLVQMDLNDETWHLVKNVPRVLGFIGGTADRPAPITAKEADAILQRVQDGVDKPKPKVLFDVGEVVRVTDGPFNDFNGVVEEVNFEKNKLLVAVQIFGRSTPVELEFSQVEKA